MQENPISNELLAILVCPESKTAVSLASRSIIDKLNTEIASGKLKNKAGDTITGALEAGLIREDNKVLYPVINGIPVMLVEEAVVIEN